LLNDQTITIPKVGDVIDTDKDAAEKLAEAKKVNDQMMDSLICCYQWLWQNQVV
jgi:hypothetical protein